MRITGVKEQFKKLIPTNLNICLLGLQGSRMLGLQQSTDADWDYRGVFCFKKEELFGIRRPKETIEINVGAGDNEAEFVFHEVGKFLELCMKGNPSVIHLLFVPKFNIKTDIGDLIIKNKNLLLAEEPIRKAFAGYALSQILYLKRNHKFPAKQKKEKHIRHCFRLFDCGQELLETGKITLPLKNPQKYFELQKIEDEDELVRLFEKRDKEFQTCKSILPKVPDEFLINKLLIKVREMSL
jgi:hypothetical protein